VEYYFFSRFSWVSQYFNQQQSLLLFPSIFWHKVTGSIKELTPASLGTGWFVLFLEDLVSLHVCFWPFCFPFPLSVSVHPFLLSLSSYIHTHTHTHSLSLSLCTRERGFPLSLLFLFLLSSLVLIIRWHIFSFRWYIFCLGFCFLTYLTLPVKKQWLRCFVFLTCLTPIHLDFLQHQLALLIVCFPVLISEKRECD